MKIKTGRNNFQAGNNIAAHIGVVISSHCNVLIPLTLQQHYDNFNSNV